MTTGNQTFLFHIWLMVGPKFLLSWVERICRLIITTSPTDLRWIIMTMRLLIIFCFHSAPPPAFRISNGIAVRRIALAVLSLNLERKLTRRNLIKNNNVSLFRCISHPIFSDVDTWCHSIIFYGVVSRPVSSVGSNNCVENSSHI